MARTKRIFNCVPSRDKQDDWQMDKAKEMGLSPKKKILPKEVDLRAKWWKIGNQGSTGACVGWATADSLLRYHFTKAKKIKPGEHMSVRFIWMASKEMDEYTDYPTTFIDDSGTSLKSALKVTKKFGALTATQLPFDGKLVKIKEANFLKVAGKYKVKAYFNLAQKKSEKLQLFKEWLAFHGPILTCLDCDDSWNYPKKDGLLTKYDKKSIDGGHAMSIVGYTEKHFIIRNSWGTDWGHKGFAYASYEYAMDAFKEAYGIVI
ncbi:MAG: C1 family peptidase [Bacteroidetes bacterium]|nr:C1 family peptidase [Bacteroidota bacterium]